MRSLPEAFVAGEQRQHIALELGRAETETLATSAEKEWPSSALSELAHPFDQRIVRILPGWQQDVRRQLAPADWNDDYTEMVRAELLRKRAVRREPATNEVATRLDRTFVVNGAAFGAQKMARLARKHFIPPDIAGRPTLTAGSTCTALALRRPVGSDGYGALRIHALATKGESGGAPCA